MTRSLPRWLAVLLALFVLLPSSAQAYIDPGTGSYLVQAVVAVVAGGLMTLKLQWHRVRSFFARGAEPEAPDSEEGR